MKKTFSILAIALVLLSCNKEHRLAMASADKDYILKVANKEFEASAWIDELKNSNFQIATVNGSSLASTFASTEIPELNEGLALKVGTFFGTYVIPVLAILSGKSSLRQFLGSVGLMANIATVIKSKKIR